VLRHKSVKSVCLSPLGPERFRDISCLKAAMRLVCEMVELLILLLLVQIESYNTLDKSSRLTRI
jgi:hypothetical protein